MKSHKDLEVWQQAIDLAELVYEVTKKYPKEELYGLTSQMRRCAVSIASNIAEGAARQGNKEFLQFLYTAVGSATELDTQIEISKRIHVMDNGSLKELQEMTTRITMMIHGLIRSIKRRQS